MLTLKTLRSEALYLYSTGRAPDALKKAKQAAVIIHDKLDSITCRSQQKALLKVLGEVLSLYDELKKKNSKAIDFQRQIEYISSNISQLLFYPWQELDESGDLNTDLKLFEDPDGLPQLSEKQKEIFQKWARPNEALGAPLSMGNAGTESLCQDSLEDCSFVASLLSIYFYEQTHKLSLLKCNVYPQDSEGNTVISPTGKYWVRLNFNGTMRRITVDDRLPITKTPATHSLIVRSSTTPGLLWPAILEKAYLKLMGGYDFLGSYSASDTYAMCSWIPEVLFINGYLQEPNASRAALWTKIMKPFKNGHLMICVGTGSISRAEADAYGLISDHDYTVMDLKEMLFSDGSVRRIVQIKNPWFSELSVNKLGSIQIPPNEAPEALNGGFWVTFDSLCLRFSSLYFNWNPQLFNHQASTNFLWSIKSIEFTNITRSYSSCPQFSISNDSATENVVWLLLSRHITDRNSISGFVTLHIYEADGNKVYFPDEFPCFRKGTFLNTFHYLLKIPIPANTAYTIVVGGNDFVCKYSSLRFSLTAYSLFPMRLGKATEELPAKKTISGVWDIDSAGGSWANDTYLNNPRFLLSVNTPIKVIKLGLVSESVSPINFKVYLSDDSRSRNLQTMKVLNSSGEYRIGCTMVKTSGLMSGNYMVVVSMFDPQIFGSFDLIARASGEFDLSQLPSINAGMFKRSLEMHWGGAARKEIIFNVGNPCSAYFRTATCKDVATTYQDQQPNNTELSPSQYRPHLRVSIFESPANKLIYSSTEFTDDEFGVYLDDLKLYPEIRYICLVERMERGYGAFKLEVHSTSPVALKE